MASHQFWDSLIKSITQTHLLTTKHSRVRLLKPRIEAVTTGVCIYSHQALPYPQGAPSPPEPQGPPGALPRLAGPRGRPPREAGEAGREGSRAAVRDPITLGKMNLPPGHPRRSGSGEAFNLVWERRPGSATGIRDAGSRFTGITAARSPAPSSPATPDQWPRAPGLIRANQLQGSDSRGRAPKGRG